MGLSNSIEIHPVILSGGSGTRLWPLSRELYPKQLLPLTGTLTLLQETIQRVAGLPGIAKPLFLCNEEHRFLVAEQIRQVECQHGGIILEPIGRNTAPALTLAALRLSENSKDAIMLVLPADHMIRDVHAFHEAVKQGAVYAAADQLVTFGIVPHAEETGYGYIKKGTPSVSNEAAAYKVAAFVEKPDLDTARRYVSSGDYLWNSGMFMLKASAWLAELKRFRPDIVDACRQAYEGGKQDGDFYRIGKQTFLACPAESIDYAVMEKTDKAVVVPLDAGWSDIGAWSALWEVCERNEEGNVIQGDVHAHATRNTLLISQHRFLAAVGVENLVIVETADAVLVLHKDHAQDVKEIVNKLKENNREEHKNHRRVFRPWGCYEGVDAGHRFQVKRLSIKPGASLSLQMHHQRAEHWVVVTGTARVTRGDEVFLLSENQSTYIPLGVKHRLENPGTMPLEIIEVQSGNYLGEDDIVRIDDIYNRHT